jgi:spermidine synthase
LEVPKVRFGYLLLFVSSACLMTVELVAGRVVAPYIGVSLYTWTGIIGACLTGMSLGHLFGGWLADRGDPRRWLPYMFFSAALLTSVLAVARTAIGALADAMSNHHVPPLIGIFALSTLFFGLPCFFLAAVSPLVYKVRLQTDSRVGVTVGRLAASGVVGSIAGTYATGFWLIPAFGTRAILLGVPLVLAALGAYCLFASPARRAVTAAVLILVPWFVGTALPVDAGAPCDVESAYYCIRVVVSDKDKETGPVKKLRLDYLTHSGYRLNDPGHLWYEYEQVVAWIVKARGDISPRTLFLGGGGYMLPHWVEREFPKAAIDVIEVDPAVTRVAKAEFVPQMQRVNSLNMDARAALRQMPEKQRYDIIFGDVFNDLSVPYHLTTVEFARLVESRLDGAGLYIVNVVDKTNGGPLVGSMAATLKQVFPYVYALPGTDGTTARGPQLLVASAKPVEWNEWEEHYARPKFDVSRFEVPSGALVLTDDYVPTDHLLLPVFSDRWAK